MTDETPHPDIIAHYKVTGCCGTYTAHLTIYRDGQPALTITAQGPSRREARAVAASIASSQGITLP